MLIPLQDNIGEFRKYQAQLGPGELTNLFKGCSALGEGVQNFAATHGIQGWLQKRQVLDRGFWFMHENCFNLLS
jgi:hypothetical protein